MRNHEKINKNKVLLIEIIIGIFLGILMILLYNLFSHLIIVKLGIWEFISPILYIFYTIYHMEGMEVIRMYAGQKRV